MLQELLPIGSVVTLKEGEKKLMVFGIKQTDEEKGVEFDYVGVIYPEGNLGKGFQFLFNHVDILKTHFRGFENEERTEFIGKLHEYYNNQESKADL